MNRGTHVNPLVQALNFRSASPEDLPLLNHLMREGKGYWGYPQEGLDRFMNTYGISDDSYFDKGFGYIAQAKKEVIGYYLFNEDEALPMLDCFFLNVRFIGKGYGRKLWEHCIEQAENKGWDEFAFWSDPHASGFYEHMGAVKIDERPMVTLPGHMAPIMRFLIPRAPH